jgi:hypothetical protein
MICCNPLASGYSDANGRFTQIRHNFALRSAQLTNLLFLARSMSVNTANTGCLCGATGPTSKDEIRWGELEYARAYVGTYYVNAM